MTLRCKPGDLAVFVRAPVDAPEVLGKIVTILHAAPMTEDFRLPDGTLHFACPYPDRWVCQFPHPVRVPMRRAGWRYGLYGVAPDWALRPIRPDADPVDVGEPVEASTC